MIPVEIMTMAGGSLVGFFFKLVAKRAENEQKRFEMFMKEKDLAIKSADKAVERIGVDAGKWVRRLIVVSVLFVDSKLSLSQAVLGHNEGLYS